MSKEDNPGPFVTRAECTKTISKFNGQIKKNTAELKTIRRALVGDDMRGGIVKDVQTIKSATNIFKTTVLPIVLSVAAAVVTYLLLGK